MIDGGTQRSGPKEMTEAGFACRLESRTAAKLLNHCGGSRSMERKASWCNGPLVIKYPPAFDRVGTVSFDALGN